MEEGREEMEALAAAAGAECRWRRRRASTHAGGATSTVDELRMLAGRASLAQLPGVA
jgi:hypothetical protein